MEDQLRTVPCSPMPAGGVPVTAALAMVKSCTSLLDLHVPVFRLGDIDGDQREFGVVDAAGKPGLDHRFHSSFLRAMSSTIRAVPDTET